MREIGLACPCICASCSMSQDFYVGDGRGAGCCAVTGITAGNTTPSSVAAVAVHFVMGSLRPWCARRVLPHPGKAKKSTVGAWLASRDGGSYDDGRRHAIVRPLLTPLESCAMPPTSMPASPQ